MSSVARLTARSLLARSRLVKPGHTHLPVAQHRSAGIQLFTKDIQTFYLFYSSSHTFRENRKHIPILKICVPKY